MKWYQNPILLESYNLITIPKVAMCCKQSNINNEKKKHAHTAHTHKHVTGNWEHNVYPNVWNENKSCI